ncbi:MAG: hypothetical protein AB7O67_05875 [Vicinamibacterales bacterium]
MRAAVQILIGLLVVNAAAQAGNVWWNYYAFRDAIHQEALFANGRTPHQIHERVMRLAADHEIPIGPDDVAVFQDGAETVIEVVYDEPIPLVPRLYTLVHTFDATVEATPARPMSADDLRP